MILPLDHNFEDIDLDDLLYKAWGLISNVSNGDWAFQSLAWRDAAEAWRNKWHTTLLNKETLKDEDIVKFFEIWIDTDDDWILSCLICKTKMANPDFKRFLHTGPPPKLEDYISAAKQHYNSIHKFKEH